MYKRLFYQWIGIICGLFCTETTYSQTQSIISGFVSSSDGSAISGTTILIKNESTGFTDGAIANERGFFTLKNVALGGPYSITAQAIGYAAVRKTGYTIGIGERLQVNFTLQDQSTQLQEVTISAEDDIHSRVSSIPSARRLGVQEIKYLPANSRNFQDLANVSPLLGVSATNNPNVGLGGTRESSTGITLDGMNQRFMMNGGLLPINTVSIEAIKEYEVATNNYDVLQGRQGGGAINVVTKAGTNQFTGSAFFYNRSNKLTAKEDFLNRPLKDFSIRQYGFALGGPIIKDKLHFFTALDFEDKSQPFSVLDVRDLTTEKAENISKTNLDRFLNILHTQYGLADPASQTGVFSVKPLSRTFFARLDWQINKTHKLTFRNNYSSQKSEFSPYATPDNAAVRESYGKHEILLFSSQLSLQSQFSEKLTHVVRVQYLKAQRDFIPYTHVPRGFVVINSTLSDSTKVSRTFQFGGNRIAPEKQGEQQLQLVDNIFLHTGKFDFTFGTDNLITFTHTLNTNEQGGLFQFSSLDDLAAKKPNAYTRLAPLNPVDGYAPYLNQTAFDVSAFAQAEYNINRKISITAGLRWDATIFNTKPAYNAAVEKAFGKRTDVVAKDFANLQPRFLFNYDIKGDQRSLFQFGFGGFSANIIHWAQLSNLLQTGTVLANTVYPKTDLPVPDYVSYRQNINTVPGVPAGSSLPPAYINLIGDNFRAPITWKTNASFRHFFGKKWFAGINVYYAHTTHNYRYTDLNLRDQPNFTLANEANRGVFAPIEVITKADPAKPTATVPYPVPYASVVRDPNFGRVLELNGDANLWQYGSVLDAGVILPGNGTVSASYTYNKTEDNNSYNCCIARTTFSSGNIVDDPRDLNENRGGANTDFRHKITVYGISPQWYGFRLAVKYVGISGNPWTPVIFGDITGDASSLTINNNKRAFIFNPAVINSNPEATSFEKTLATDMTKLLNNPENTASDYLKDHLGQIAERNAIYNPFWHNVDVGLFYTLDNQLIKSMKSHKVILQFQVFNFINLLDKYSGRQLVVPSTNQQLYRTLGIDPQALAQGRQQYAYSVNPTFGQRTPINQPYQIQLGARYEF